MNEIQQKTNTLSINVIFSLFFMAFCSSSGYGKDHDGL